ncbi:MAG: carboxypeptidase-like regulatory domain-containing protein [Paludibacteraceae bacterium]
MKKFITLFCAVAFCAAVASAESNNKSSVKESNVAKSEQVMSLNVTISGTITDLKNNETLAGATIYVDGKKYYSDLDGNFNFSALSVGKHRISVELISYNATEMEVDVKNNTNLKIQLVQQ